MKPLSNVKRVSQEAEECKAKICSLLGWSELEYGECQFENGLLYLSIYLQDTSWAVDLIKHNRVFWSWWKNHWTIRDKQFLIYAQGTLTPEQMVSFYSYYHCGEELAKSIRPTALVLNDTYAQMMGQLIDQTP